MNKSKPSAVYIINPFISYPVTYSAKKAVPVQATVNPKLPGVTITPIDK